MREICGGGCGKCNRGFGENWLVPELEGWPFWKVNRCAAAASYFEVNADFLAGVFFTPFLKKYLSSVDSGLLCEEGMSVLLLKIKGFLPFPPCFLTQDLVITPFFHMLLACPH